MELKKFEIVSLVNYTTRERVALGTVREIDHSRYPFSIELANDFKIGEGDDEMSFKCGEIITFDNDLLYRGIAHADHKGFDIQIAMFDEKDVSGVCTYSILQEDIAKEILEMSVKIDNALEPLLPYLKSGKLSRQALLNIIDIKISKG
ncbi:hypothetical protein vBSflM004_123 [Shigella phage vB_SflM_004]|uniref:Uncharacterized protein n=1 Tax=Shigella phage Sf15 TaxID=2024317 RepID=A0A291AYG9_9CAUD|nr:hypothetical protein Sf15_gp121 [Shigella phage Sf15]AZV01512.1 hypothetical protein vBSflM004_123 [Shigella phage vB_SflM_004]